MPVRLGTSYVKNIRVRWTDKSTGKRRSKAFRWRGPAEREARWLRMMGHGDVEIETLDPVEAFREKQRRRGLSEESIDRDVEIHFGS
jgi:hypothetical protein